MFSLIITLISIALVVALVLSSLYYGGNAFAKGTGQADAAKVSNQGQLLLGAADLYFVAQRAWPASIEQLVLGGYLKAFPTPLVVASAWSMPVAGQPLFVHASTSLESCSFINKNFSLGRAGVLSRAYSGLLVQCYASSSVLPRTIFRKDLGIALTGAVPAAELLSGVPPLSASDPAWFLPPDAAASSSAAAPAAAPAGVVSLSRASYAFSDGKLARYYQKDDEIVLTNNTASAITIDSVQTDDPDYTLDLWTGSCYRLASYPQLNAGQSCSLSTSFWPQTLGTFTAVGTVATSAGSLRINLSGTAMDGPPLAQLSLDHTYVSKQALAVGGVEPFAFVVTNTGTVSAPIAPQISEGLPANISAGTGCPPSLAPAQSCTLTFSVASPMPRAFSYNVNLFDEDNQFLKNFALFGTAQFPSKALSYINPEYPYLDNYGQILKGSHPVGQAVSLTGTLTNLTVWPVDFKVMTQAAQLTATQQTGTDRVQTAYTTTCPAVIAPGQSCTLTFSGTPLEPMDYQADMSIYFNGIFTGGFSFKATGF